MILISKVLLGSAAAAMLAGSAAVPGALEMVQSAVGFLGGPASAAAAAPSDTSRAETLRYLNAASHCTGSCDAFALLAQAR